MQVKDKTLLTSEETLLTTDDLCRILGCKSRDTIIRYSNEGFIPHHIRIDRAYKWKKSDMILFMSCDCDMAQYKKEQDNGH